MSRRCLVVLLALAPGVGLAGPVYVNDPVTSDDVAVPGCASMGAGADVSGCGSCAAPCASPQYALASRAIAPGDVLYLNAGRYLAPAASKIPYLVFAPDAGGTAGNPVTVRGATDARGRPLAWIDGNAANSGATAGVQVQANWVSIENLKISDIDCPNGGKAPYGSGVYVDPTAPGWVGVSIVNVEVTGLGCPVSAPIDFDSVATPCTGCRIVGCNLYDNPGSGGIYLGAADGLEIRGNRLERNAVGRPGDYPGILVNGGVNLRIEGNLVTGVGGSGIAMTECAISTWCGTRKSNNVKIAGNTIWKNQVAPSANALGEIELVRSTTGVSLENNIIGATRSACVGVDTSVPIATAFASSDYNDFFPDPGVSVARVGTTPASTLADWQTLSSLDSASVQVDPLFVSATDFHLKSTAGRPAADGGRTFDAVTSPLIDLGNPATPVGGEPVPNGGRVNLGAYGGTAEGSQTPVQLSIVSGDGQLGAPGAALPLELVVAVQQFDGGPVPAALVQFFPTLGGGAVNPSLRFTDGAGLARTVATLSAAGPHTFVAHLPDVFGAQDVVFSATALYFADAGTDGGAVDAGPADAGSSDAGEVPDAGTDAGTPEVDAGFDGGSVDAGLDAGIEPGYDGGADAGEAIADAGLDAGTGATDGGAEAEGPSSFSPDVGCGCTGTGSLAGLEAAVFAVLLALRRGRRGRAQRNS